MSKEERKRAEESLRKLRQQQKEERQQAFYDADATLAKYNANEDAKFEREISDIFGASLDDMRKAFEKNPPEMPKVAQAMNELYKADRKGNKPKARRIAKRNKAAIKAEYKKSKSKGGCLASLAVLMTISLGSFYGIFELIGHIFGV